MNSPSYSQVIGTDELNAYLNKYQLERDPQLEALVGRYVNIQHYVVISELLILNVMS